MRSSKASAFIFLVFVISGVSAADAGRYDAFVFNVKGVDAKYQTTAWHLDRYTGELKQCFVDSDFSYNCIDRTTKEQIISDGRSLRFALDKWWNSNNKALGYSGAVRIDTETGEILFCSSRVLEIQKRTCYQIMP